jgi:hypothetical protein
VSDRRPRNSAQVLPRERRHVSTSPARESVRGRDAMHFTAMGQAHRSDLLPAHSEYAVRELLQYFLLRSS